ncbi:hypothetical protein LIER_11611 [Lithospermum erythrorhizon]|uniref:Uncharacterized protein n=1 Tax=Lithospermum erythrorhizon TaxID=34254 RepID=A0AAV3PPX7_LITER
MVWQEENARGNDRSPRVTGRVDTIWRDSRRRRYLQRKKKICLKCCLRPAFPRWHPRPIISNFVVARMLVDTGISADILYLRAYDKLGLARKHPKPGIVDEKSPKRKRYQEKHPGIMNIGEPTESERQDNDPKDSESHKRGAPNENFKTVAFDERKPDRCKKAR